MQCGIFQSHVGLLIENFEVICCGVFTLVILLTTPCLFLVKSCVEVGTPHPTSFRHTLKVAYIPWIWMLTLTSCLQNLRQDPLDLGFWSFQFDFFAPWYRRRREATSVKISLKNSKEKLVKCATEVARLHKVSIQSCTQKRPSAKVQSLSRNLI